MSKWYRLNSICPTYWIKHLTHTQAHTQTIYGLHCLINARADSRSNDIFLSALKWFTIQWFTFILFFFSRRHHRCHSSVRSAVTGGVRNGEEFKPMCAKDQCDEFLVVVRSKKFRQLEKGNHDNRKQRFNQLKNKTKHKKPWGWSKKEMKIAAFSRKVETFELRCFAFSASSNFAAWKPIWR